MTEVNIKQNLKMLRTMNPQVITKGGADLCSWAADTIEMLAAYAAHSQSVLRNPTAYHVVAQVMMERE